MLCVTDKQNLTSHMSAELLWENSETSCMVGKQKTAIEQHRFTLQLATAFISKQKHALCFVAALVFSFHLLYAVC